MNITFLGAADAVTGSRHLVEIDGQHILLDCGLFQGFKTLRERNWAPLPVPPGEIEAVVLSHAHLDHSGWLPALVKQGFRGAIHCTPATRDLAEVLLLDSAHLQEEDARRANRQGFSRHAPALPLYTVADARRAIARLEPLPPGRKLRLGSVNIELTPVGHLLGACAVTLRGREATVVFSRRPTCCWSSRPTATGCTRRRTCRPNSARSCVRRCGAAARCCCPRSRSAAPRR
jgi:metallo-beta-lactamase family protein